MYYLYAPWRGTYTRNNTQMQPQYSPFTQMLKSSDDASHFVLKRLQYHGIILNQYPYNPGHILIVPYRQVSKLDALTHPERYELMQATTESVRILEHTIHNSGTNVGLNLGDKSSGGSVLYHLHMHVIPRWHGDTSFLPVMSETKVLSEDLQTVYNALLQPFHDLNIDVPSL